MGIQDAFFYEVKCNFFTSLHVLSDARVGANHFIIHLNTTNVSVVVVNQFELCDNITLADMPSCVDDISLVNSILEIYFRFVIEANGQHVFMSPVPMLTLWGARVVECGRKL